MMKILILIAFVILLSFGLANATERADFCFQESNLNLCWCINGHWWGATDDKTQLYYKGISKFLNDYIKANVQDGKLDNKKFEVQTGCVYINGSDILPREISRGRKGYYAIIGGNPNLEYLVKIVNYFSSENWKSFIFGPGDCLECGGFASKSAYKTARSTIKNILDKEVGSPDMAFFNGKNVKVYETGNLEIRYENDKLNIYLNDKPLNIDFRDPLPMRINNRYVIVSTDKLLVYENDNLVAEKVLRLRLPEESFRMKVYKKWVNFHEIGNTQPFMSYSYEKNKFYRAE